MFKKMLPWVIMLLVVLTLIIAAAFLLWDKLFSDDSQDPNTNARKSVEDVSATILPPEQIKEFSVDINDILTNLLSGDIVKISFTFELNNAKTKEEFTLLDFKIKAIINQVLSDLTPEEVKGSQGMDLINSTLINKINQLLSKGKVREINITSIIIT